ncbi:cell wall hydrolase [Kushneria aurantia]|nr:cell wall hydrolase [Kushneria aurantia]
MPTPLPRLLPASLAGLIALALSLSPALADNTSPGAAVAMQKAEILESRASDAGGVQPLPSGVRLSRDGVRAVDPRGQAPLNDAVSCLARSIYWEAKGTPRGEMEAVANVVMNRLGSSRFPSTLCGVVQEGSETGRCQFSWWCDGRPDEAHEMAEYATAREIARLALNGQLADRTRGALFFHHKSITPSWASSFIHTMQSREFDFYRPPG